MNRVMELGGASTLAAGASVSELDAMRGEFEPKNILLLDAVRLFLRLEETLLQRREWNLFSASSGAEALEILARESVDLLVMDYVLPDMTGDEVVRNVRSDARTRNTGILILTARGMREHVDRCMQAGCNSFLFKPVTRATLCSRVQEMLHVPARRHVRTLVRIQVDAQQRDRFFFGTTVNLSASGILLECPLALSLGEPIQLRFFLPGDPRPVMAAARVARTARTSGMAETAYGLVFESLADGDKARVDDFVTDRASCDAPVAED